MKKEIIYEEDPWADDPPTLRASVPTGADNASAPSPVAPCRHASPARSAHDFGG